MVIIILVVYWGLLSFLSTQAKFSSDLPRLDVPQLLNKGGLEPPLRSVLTAIYVLQEKNLVENNDTLIYVKPGFCLDLEISLALSYGLYNLTNGMELSGGQKISQTSKFLTTEKSEYEKLMLELSVSESAATFPVSPKSPDLPVSLYMLNSLYGRPIFTPDTYRLFAAIHGIEITIMVLCVILICLAWSLPLFWSLYIWVFHLALQVPLVILLTCYLTLYCVANGKVPLENFGGKVSVLALHLVLNMGVVGLLVFERMIENIARANNGGNDEENALQDLTYSTTSGLSAVPSPLDKVPTLDVIHSLPLFEEKVEYNGRIQLPMVLPKVRKLKTESAKSEESEKSEKSGESAKSEKSVKAVNSGPEVSAKSEEQEIGAKVIITATTGNSPGITQTEIKKVEIEKFETNEIHSEVGPSKVDLAIIERQKNENDIILSVLSGTDPKVKIEPVLVDAESIGRWVTPEITPEASPVKSKVSSPNTPTRAEIAKTPENVFTIEDLD